MVTIDRVLEIAHAPLSRSGLSREQYNALRILRGVGEEGLPTYRVVARMVSRGPNITRLAAKLEGKGLLTRSRSGADGRVRTLRITPAGLRLLWALDGPIEESTRRAMQGLNEEETGSLLRLLEKTRRPLIEETKPLRSPAIDGGEGETERREQ
ncbi:MAG: MarR family transcriptional regulator [Candidatus Eisenbacteria bacterium]